MKRFSVMLLVLAFAVSLAVPVLAGDFGIKGKYVLDFESRDQGSTEAAWIDDDLDLDIDVTQGDVKFHWDIEVADGFYSGHANDGNANLVDGYYVQWAYNDALKFKAGEWGLGFGRAIAMYNRGGHNWGGTYSLDAVDLSLWVGKVVEDGDSLDAADLDEDDIQLVASFKDAGPFTKLALTYLSNKDDINDTSDSALAVDFAVPAGPVALAGEFGSQSGDTLDGVYYIAEFGLDEVVGFDLGLTYFSSDADFSAGFGEDYDVTYLYGDVTDVTWVRVAGSYGVNDDLTVGAKAMVMAEDDAGNDQGTAFDIYGTYKFADNVSSTLTYGNYSPDTGDSLTGMRARFTFNF